MTPDKEPKMIPHLSAVYDVFTLRPFKDRHLLLHCAPVCTFHPSVHTLHTPADKLCLFLWQDRDTGRCRVYPPLGPPGTSVLLGKISMGSRQLSQLRSASKITSLSGRMITVYCTQTVHRENRNAAPSLGFLQSLKNDTIDFVSHLKIDTFLSGQVWINLWSGVRLNRATFRQALCSWRQHTPLMREKWKRGSHPSCRLHRRGELWQLEGE